MIRKMVRATVKPLSDDEVEVRMSTGALARDGHVLVPQGAILDNYRNNPVFLWNHDVDNPPVGRAEQISVNAEEIVAQVRFAPVGISQRADEIRGLTKAGFINGVSVGFEPLDGEPLDAKFPKRGQRFTSWDLLECSFCCVPVDTESLVTARALRAAAAAEDWKCGASRDLPIEDSDAWDGAAAEHSIFEWAGGDDFDPSKARKGFLAYDATSPKERGSYKLPIAHVVDGRLKVPKGAIRAASSRLPQTDIPESVKTSAQAVIKHYEEKAGMSGNSKDTDRSVKAKHNRALERAPRIPTFKRGLYEVSSLACLLNQLGYAQDCSEYEAAIEEDDSPVPAMLGESLKSLGAALIAMTAEEVRELLEHADVEVEIDEEADELDVEERAYLAAAKTPRQRAWRRGVLIARAGKTLSKSNAEKLEEAQDHQARAMKHHRAMAEHHEAVGKHMDAQSGTLAAAAKQHDEIGEALEQAKSEPEKAPEHVKRALKAHAKAADHLEALETQSADMKDRHQDVGDAHAAMGRCMRAAERCVRAVTAGAAADAGDTDGDSKKIQTSSGTEESEGAANGRASATARRRALDELALVARAY